ncbi:MAG: spermidine synthase [Desulfotignum sp.]|nr:spermidine synthase [Desulfotignum sp.]MCF8126307.1 spermidine synthase [Desulfotignum sp.]
MKNSIHVKDGWFFEICNMWPGMALSLEIENILYDEKSLFQHIQVFETKNHGKMLALDGIIQLTESDEFSYQEMLAHIPLFAHPRPETVLVIGGGDGGILREAGRHACVKTMDFCEIDEMVITVSKQFLPDLACGFDDPRVNVFIRDGAAFVREKTGRYDVIIVDSSDPIGPGEVLFKKPFYESLKNALKPGGIIATQGESIFLHQDCVTNLAKITRDLFKQQAYACFIVPTYPGGNIGVCLGSLGPELTRPAREIPAELQSRLKYYTPRVHEAAFVLPHFAQVMLEAL